MRYTRGAIRAIVFSARRAVHRSSRTCNIENNAILLLRAREQNAHRDSPPTNEYTPGAPLKNRMQPFLRTNELRVLLLSLHACFRDTAGEIFGADGRDTVQVRH